MKLLLLNIIMIMGIGHVSAAHTDTLRLSKGEIDELYTQYKEPAFTYRRFKHDDIFKLLHKHQEDSVLSIVEIGKSVNLREIYRVQYGQGPQTVMLWSQMHGDEATATMALFDLFNFLEGKNDGFDSIRQLLKEKTSLYFIPMLNPDGAEDFKRRTAMNIDMNRDARAGKTVEGALLKAQALAIQPRYAFNLHDQNIYYNIPGTATPVSIALLAPAFNKQRDINAVRQGAMQIIAGMNRLLQQYIPQAVAKYDDEYSPRGFGDNFQSWGASTVLIESGAYAGDPEKMEIRKLNFAIILNALLEIAQGTYRQYPVAEYHQLPFNASQLHDVLLRDIEVQQADGVMQMDIAIRRSEVTRGRTFYVESAIEDLGDLQDFYGYAETAAQGLRFVPAKHYPHLFNTIDDISKEEAFNLLKQGYAAVTVDSYQIRGIHNLPLRIFGFKSMVTAEHLNLGTEATFFLAQGDRLKYAVVNGFLIDLEQPIYADHQSVIQ